MKDFLTDLIGKSILIRNTFGGEREGIVLIVTEKIVILFDEFRNTDVYQVIKLKEIDRISILKKG